MSAKTKSLSTNYVTERFGVIKKAERLFMHKVIKAMKSSCNQPMIGRVHYKFVLGGKEKGKIGRSCNSKKKKVVCAVELTEEGKFQRIYSMKINNYSAKELSKLI